MKVFMLSLVMLIGVSFAANAGCTDCWAFADGYAHAGKDWFEGLDYCNENLNPCRDQLPEIIIKA